MVSVSRKSLWRRTDVGAVAGAALAGYAASTCFKKPMTFFFPLGRSGREASRVRGAGNVLDRSCGAPGQTGMEKEMEELYTEGVATTVAPSHASSPVRKR